MPPPPALAVSDHALLRYWQRRLALDIDGMRAASDALQAALKRASRLGMTGARGAVAARRAVQALRTDMLAAELALARARRGLG
jgi:hypothetical protein